MTAVKKLIEAVDIMPDVVYTGFYEESSKVILEALSHVEMKCAGIVNDLIETAPVEMKERIVEHFGEVDSSISKTREEVKEWAERHTALDSEDLAKHKMVVKSALQVYRNDLAKIQKEMPSEKTKKDIDEVDRILSLEHMKNNPSNFFDGFLGAHAINSVPFVFISHHHNDKRIAKVLKDYLAQVGVVGFVAHEDIVDDKDWNPQITENLEKSTHVFVLITDDFHTSAYGNQEVGFAYGMSRKNGLPEITHFCFQGKRPNGMLYERQATDINESNFHDIVSDKINRSLGLKFNFSPHSLPSPLFRISDDMDVLNNLTDFKQILQGLWQEAQNNAVAFSHGDVSDIRPINYDLFEKKGDSLSTYMREKGVNKDYITLCQKLRAYNQNTRPNTVTKWVVLGMASDISSFQMQLNELK